MKNIHSISILLSLAVVFLLTIACGGGGGGAEGVADSGQKLKARFSPQGILNYLDGDQLFIYKLGESQPITEIENLADVPGFVTATFDLNENYLLVVRRLGVVNFLSTVITADQINQARQTGVLSLGKLNSITTLLSHYLDLSSGGVPYKSTAEIKAEVSKYFEGVDTFAELSFEAVKNQIVKKDAFYEDFANRSNAMTAFSALLHLKQKESIASGNALSSTQKAGYLALHNAIMTGDVTDWVTQVNLLKSGGVLPDLDNSLQSFLDGNADASKNLGIQNKIFDTDGIYYVIDINDLHSVFYDTDSADESLFDNFIDSVIVPRTENSVISGNIGGPGMAGAEVVLYRDTKSGTGYVVQSVVSDSGGEFDFGNVPSDDSYQVMVRKPGYLYKAGSALTKAGNVQLTINSYSWDMETLVLDSNGNISLADGAVTSVKLSSDITVQNLNVTGTANLRGMVLPEGSSGTVGQVLALDASGNLVFTNDIDTDTDTDTVLDVSGAVNITGDWINTANPWSDSEVAPNLTIDGGSVNNSPVGATNASTGAFTDLSAGTSFSVNGLKFPVADGAPNQVLSTDGTGNISFMTVSISNDGQTYNQVEIESGNVTGNVVGAMMTASTIDSTTIGANSPSTGSFSALTVVGSSNLGGLLMPMADGTVGQILTTDGSGNLVFANDDTGTAPYFGPWADGNISTALTLSTNSTIDDTPIGAATPSTGSFTSLVTGGSTNLAGLLMPTSDGAAGQVLTTNGSGNLVFANDDTGTAPYFGPWADGNVSNALTLGANSTIDDTPIGATTPSTGSFTTLVSTGSSNLAGLLMPTVDGTMGQVLTTDGAGNLTFASVAAGGSSGANLSATETILANWVNVANPWADNEVANNLTVLTGNVNNSPIGATTPSTGAFTTLSANLSFSLNGMVYPLTDGTANQVLATDGSGNIGFMTVSISNDSQSYTNALIQSGNFTGNVVSSTLTAATIGASTFSLNGMAYPVVDGSANQVLATDGAGALTFIDVSTSNDGQTYTNAWIQSGNFTGNVVSSTINSSAIGDEQGSSGNFTSLAATANLTVDGSANLAGLVYPTADGSANQFLVTAGNGHMTFASVNVLLGNLAGNYTIEGGSIDSTVIGATTPAAGTFTVLTSDNLTVSENITAGNLNLSGNMSNLVVVGNTTLGNDASADSLTIMSTVGPGTTVGGNIWFQGNLISNSDSYSLGTKSNPWKRIYAIDLVTTSDERLKEEIEPIEYGLDEVMKLKPVSYKWKDQAKDQERTLGFLAQEVETVIDEVVTDTNSEEETMGVRYGNMVPVLIKAMQQQQEMIAKQARLIEEQARRLEALEAKPEVK